MISNEMKKIIPQSIKNIYHLQQAILANIWHGFPSRRLKVIGVTGTNGKTTTVQMIAKILENAGYKIAIASTINFKIGEKEWVNASKFTTLSSFKLQRHLKEAAKAGCEYAIVEVTSHALDQNRVWGVDFSVAAITNITREHLDYHKTMDKYAEAKEKLFELVSKNKKTATVINLNSEFADKFLRHEAGQKYGYFLESPASHASQSDAGRQNPKCAIDKNIQLVIARDIKLEIGSSKFIVGGKNFSLNLPLEFNIENALAAICTGLSQNIPLEKISGALSMIKGVPGRMEKIENKRDLDIIVDYAVTPDSLEKIYTYLNGLKKENSRIIAVFGSCGERDRGKRPIMGEIVSHYADFVFVTNEDPYSEDPQEIIDEVFTGVLKYKKENENAWRISDRREAIKKALQIAKPGDIVAATGKGAEETMAIGNKRIPWNDPKVIRELLQETGSGKNQ
jgi:UDP-N-acetylmuramoyl-L-alanyl-D-glutamate--2,6-diaminopimelate ligase